MIDDIARGFIRDLRINIGELGEAGSLSLWRECEWVEEPFADRVDEVTLSVWNRLQQATYYKALDTFVDILELTLLGSVEGDLNEDEDG